MPRLPADTVRRPLLRRELDKICDVGLVCAPAGYGKTLLLAEWAEAARPERDTAWVHLDSDDNDPRLFWSAVLAALARCPAIPATSVVRTGPGGRGWDLSAAGRPEFGADVAVALAELDRPVCLVLDDLQQLHSPEALHDVAMLLRNRPRTVPVALGSRTDPPIGLQRLRPEGRLRELRTDRLRLDRDEAEVLLHSAGVRLRPDQLERLYRQTEGWPVGLRFAATALGPATDVEGFLSRFSGAERAVADYLVGEVLDGLPHAAVDLLRRTSICDEIPTALAVELSGREDAGHVLGDLESRSALVRRHGRRPGTYRLQPLVRSLLLAELHQRSAHGPVALHVAAARWWLEGDHPLTALKHAAQAEDATLLVEVIARAAIPLLVRGQHKQLRHALRSAGGVVAADPWLSLAEALAADQSGDRPAAVTAARRARRRWPTDPPAVLTALGTIADQLYGLTSVGQGAGPGDEDPCPSGVLLGPEAEALLQVAHCAARLRDRRVDDDVRGVRRVLDDVVASARDAGWDHLLLQSHTTAAAAAAADHDVRAMREHATHAHALATARGWTTSPAALRAVVVLAHAALLAADPDQALGLVREALPRAETAEPRLRFALLAVCGAAATDLGDHRGGLSTLQQARVVLGDHEAGLADLALAATAEFDAAVRLGHHTAARAGLSWLAGRCGSTGEILLLRARSDVIGGRTEQARLTLQRLVDGATPTALPSTIVEAQLLCCELAVRAGDRFAAGRALRDAVGMAEAHDVVRPFVHVGPVVRPLLAQQYGSLEVAHTLPGRALVLAAGDSDGLDAVLSNREQDVLELLPSLLSLEEIAADLRVSVNTVKTHVRSIYAKLGVGSRRDAVVVGYEHGLMHRTLSPTLPTPTAGASTNPLALRRAGSALRELAPLAR
ncbi:LuxR C-terminal-related transcriptional regulator [Pseudonocardia sp. RS11V-5]|uniref:helix-turn-helix transcriptional regulator n=1 Tax=Pseudonocardia terrae TaxID=2905831 RepID=UPI001E4A1DB6|nr:LuxR C-terminal-related transcriptional regulator [Pseudonocardia terrae]MCE3555458.1 LuxR C-terminal-related transcriptional regulator [Pseudonocardia terrae]